MPGFELISVEERRKVNNLFYEIKKKKRIGFYNSNNVANFEKTFSNLIGSKYAVAVSSGTAAIKIALVAAGVKRGDEVITQAFTFIATVEAILDIGAKPIITQINETLNMCPIDLKKKITNKTKAIIPVHMLGVSCQIDEIKKIAKKKKIVVIDDNCEALGAKWRENLLGNQFEICTWSFDTGKTITTGEGGMITTNNKKYYQLCKEYKDHGHQNNPKFSRGRDTARIYGFNFRMTELNAAIGLAQLKKVKYIVKKNKNNYEKIFNSLKKFKGLKFREIPEHCTPLYDCLIFNLRSKPLASRFVRLINSYGLVTKNVPDAIQWHFAKYWKHIFLLSKKKLHIRFKKSDDLLSRSVAIPIYVNEKERSLRNRINIFIKTLKKLEIK